ncbi:MAG: hypothetical protein ACC682_11770 [Gemmatimonadota bacterium]
MRRVDHVGLLAFALACTAAVAAATQPLVAQELPLPLRTAHGRTVTPAYEGWYENPDGTIAMSFGYYNRNMSEIVEVPLGENNFVEPAQFDGTQPTTLHPGRHFGVFAINVPADFDPEARVYWTLEIRGGTYRIPGHLHPDWKIDAIVGEAGSGNKPPVLKFEADGEEGMGPGGVTGPARTTSAGETFEVTVWARDDGAAGTSVRGSGQPTPVTLTWFKHQGPGEVAFGEPTGRVPVEGGSATTSVMFSQPGEYVLRVRANDASGVARAGHAQCCWTNGFVKVTVSP